MKILFVIPSLLAMSSPRSGVLAQAKHQADALRARGHSVHLASPWDPPEPGSVDVVHFFQGGLGLHGIQSLGNYLEVPTVFAPIIDSNVSDRQYALAAFLGNRTSRFFTIPGVLKRQARQAQLVVCRSTHEKRRVVRGLGVPEEKTAVVLNGVKKVTPPLNPEEFARKLGVESPFVLHVGIYSDRRKNVARLIRATAGLGVRLVIAGAAKPCSELDSLHQLGASLGHVTFLGQLTEPELASLYALARVFCLPSLHEGTGLVALEAASLGTPVVITERGGTADYFGQHAHYVDPLDEESVRAAVARALAEGTNSKLAAHVASLVDWHESARSLELCYERLTTPL